MEDKYFDEALGRLRNIKRKASSEHIQPQKYECDICKDTEFIYSVKDGYEVATRCTCYALKQAKRMIERSGISEEFQKKTFDNFLTKNNRKLEIAKEKAIEYTHTFLDCEKDRQNSILLSGQVGAGKTHLGTAICSSLMNEGVAVIYMAYRNAVTKIKQNLLDEQAYNKELKNYLNARVLYIDDFLKGKLTESDINIMYEIVNYRYMNNMPMIISTEKSPIELVGFDEAVGSRIIEMCRGYIVHFEGKELNHRLS